MGSNHPGCVAGRTCYRAREMSDALMAQGCKQAAGPDASATAGAQGARAKCQEASTRTLQAGPQA